MAKSHYELKQQQLKKKNSNTITDADYILRDIGTPEDTAKNIIDITPEAFRAKPAAKAAKTGD